VSTRVVNLRDFRDPANPRRFILPPDVVRIDRPSRWGNPFKIGGPDPEWCGQSIVLTIKGIERGPLDRGGAIYHFRLYAVDRLSREPDWLEPLRGNRLACWCAPLPCHGDVIAELIPWKTAP